MVPFDWLVSVKLMFSDSPVLQCVSFILSYGQVIFHCMNISYHILFIDSWTNRYLNCFHLSAIMNIDVVYIFVLLWTNVLNSVMCVPAHEIVEWCIIFMCSHLSNWIPKCLPLFIINYQKYMRPPIFLHPQMLAIICLFDDNHTSEF